MSSLSIEERFTLDAPPSVVWGFLTDPEQVVGCLPGAKLTGRTDDSTYEGTVKVSAGPVTVAYRGKAVFEEIDEERRFVKVVARGRETSGSGTASMTMESRVEEAADGGSQVAVQADVQVAGKIVRFGRGMIQSVSAEMFADFTKRLEERVSALEEAGASGRPDARERIHDEVRTDDEGRSDDGGRGGDEASEDSLALVPLLWRSFKRWLGGIFG